MVAQVVPGRAVRRQSRRLAAVGLLALAAAGCTSFPVAERSQPEAVEPVPAAEPPAEVRTMPAPPAAEPLPRPVPQPAPEALPEVPPSYHPAGEALVEQARREALLGNVAAAGSTLERALRIDGGNPWIWIELGHLRLDAGQAGAAESMARKALSLATTDPQARQAAERLLALASGGR